VSEKHVKMSITVPQAVADRITAAVESGAYPTASAVIADVVGTRLTPRETRAAIAGLREGRPIDEDAMAYWRARLAPGSAQAAAS
jgi:Arc/MetJ-type ribon-helix-helix transcriptional regulator